MEPDQAAPAVSVLIATYNRAHLLPRAVASVLKQTFTDFEIIIIDDHSTDGTEVLAATFTDPRIRYFRNETNQGAEHGDRAHVRRAVHQLMRGKYFVYLCDDDFWLPDDLLERQVEAFRAYPSLGMVVGGNGHTYDLDMMALNDAYVPVPGAPPFTVRIENVLPSGFLESKRYLDLFAAKPISLNILDGGTMYLRDAFIRAGVFGSPDGSRWQAGFEFKVGPALMGDVFYIDEACVIAGVDAGNASFRGTQLEHYLDCIKGVEIAFRNAWPSLSADKQRDMARIRRKFIFSITTGYLKNRLTWNVGGFANNQIDHTHMFQENVTPWEIMKVYSKHRIVPSLWQIRAILSSRHGDNTSADPKRLAAARKVLSTPDQYRWTWPAWLSFEPYRPLYDEKRLYAIARVKYYAVSVLQALGVRETLRRMTGR